MLKLYVVVRNDIDIPFQMCQVTHAVADFAISHPDEFEDWNTGNNTLCVLRVENEGQLERLVETAKDGDFKFTAFYEPERGSVDSKAYYGPYYHSITSDDVYYIPFSYHDDRDGNGPWLTAVAFAPNWTVQNVLLADLPLALDDDAVKRKVGLHKGYEIVKTLDLKRLETRASALSQLEQSSQTDRRWYFKNLNKKKV